MIAPKLITTADGSHSLFVPELNETYHSKHGAIQESNHVFIEAGLKSDEVNLQLKSIDTTLKVLEMGFGTGLNAFLTLFTFPQRIIHYTSLEAYPIDYETVRKLNYADLFEQEGGRKIFEALHDCAWNEPVSITPNFQLTKLQQKLEEAILPPHHFNVVYYDAFAPEVQAELWTEEVFEKIYASMQSNGILTTYCAKGVVKRTLKKVGFEVVGLPGPPGKREMTKAVKL
ncbi:MAG: tRNA (5-methylaminomethyl-2-thiouridine)(34)-methyltransferase MnmD [Chitinophagales bacterium]